MCIRDSKKAESKQPSAPPSHSRRQADTLPERAKTAERKILSAHLNLKNLYVQECPAHSTGGTVPEFVSEIVILLFP